MRGRSAEPGDTRVSANGYHYTRTVEKWRLTHHIMAEQILGRPLKPKERVRFKDNDRTNLEHDNIETYMRGSTTVGQERAKLLAKKAEVEAKLKLLDS